jgi:hypothetical protein
VERDDVGVLERGGELDLAPEPVDVEPGPQVRGQDLEDDLPSERGLLRHEDARHPPAAELTLDAIGVA